MALAIAPRACCEADDVRMPAPPPTPPTVPPPPPPGPDTTPPSQPANLGVGSVTRTSVSLTWSPSTDNVAVSGYRVYVNGTGVLNPTQPGATVTALACGTAFTFEVDASDAAGNRSTRARVTTSTSACADTQAPTTPTNVAASSRTATSIALSWSPSTDNVGVTGYGLYRGGTASERHGDHRHLHRAYLQHELHARRRRPRRRRQPLRKGDGHGRDDRLRRHRCAVRSPASPPPT